MAEKNEVIIVFLILVTVIIIGIIVFLIFLLVSNNRDNNSSNGSSNVGSNAKLEIKNSSGMDIWVENRVGTDINNTVPGYSTPIFVAAGDSITFNFPASGLASARFWPKIGCDNNGTNCIIGDQLPDLDGNCPSTGCTPAIDTLFEITSECTLENVNDCTSPPNNSENRVDFLNMSLVDGYSLPFKLTVIGDTSKCSAGIQNGLDGSQLTLDKCPADETITNVSTGESFEVDLAYFANNTVYACMSPCRKLVSPVIQQGLGESESDFPAVMYCCPTPENVTPCVPEDGCVTPATCRAGPIEDSQYVEVISTYAPGNYSFSYDDEDGLHTCPNTYSYKLEYFSN